MESKKSERITKILQSPFFWGVCIGIVSFFLYLPAINFDFLNWDDQKYVTENPHIELNWENVKFYFTNFYFLMYLPITMISLSLDYAIAEFEPAVFHTTNIVLHLINTFLVFVLVYKLFGQSGNKHKLEIAVITTALFGIHTLHVESVVWIAERKDVMYSVFYLVSLIFYLKYVKSKKYFFLIASLLVFILSLISKAQAMTLIFSVIGIDFLLSRKMNTKLVLEKIPFFLCAAFFGFIAIMATRSKGTENLDDYPLYERLIYANYAYLRYIFKLFIPHHLSAIYPFPDKVYDEVPWFVWASPLPVLGIAASFFVFLKKNKAIAFGIWFFTTNIVIVLQIFSYHNVIMADRYTYIAAIGIFIIIAMLYDKLVSYKAIYKTPAKILITLYIFFLVYQSYNRIPVWKNSIVLWSDVIEKYHDTAIAFHNRGVALFEETRYEEALSDFRNVFKLDPTAHGSYFSYGNTLSEMGDLQNALLAYNKSIKIDSTEKDVYINRGITKAKTGDFKGAVKDFDKAIDLDSSSFNAFSNRGNTKVILGDLQGAITDYTMALKIKPDFTDAFVNRGLAYLQTQEHTKAFQDFNKTLLLMPKHSKAYYYRATCYMNQQNWTAAIDDFSKAIRLNPNNPDAYFNRGNAKLNKGDFPEAIKDYDKVVKMLPKHALPYYWRGIAKVKAGLTKEACTDFSQSYRLGNQGAAAELQKYCQ